MNTGVNAFQLLQSEPEVITSLDQFDGLDELPFIVPDSLEPIKTLDGIKIQALKYKFKPDGPIKLYGTDNTPLVVKGMRWRYTYINWSPGQGHTSFKQPCPLHSKNDDFRYPKSKEYQIVPQLIMTDNSGYTRSLSCQMEDSLTGWGESFVIWDVNDRNGQYGDNDGVIVFYLLKWW